MFYMDPAFFLLILRYFLLYYFYGWGHTKCYSFIEIEWTYHFGVLTWNADLQGTKHTTFIIPLIKNFFFCNGDSVYPFLCVLLSHRKQEYKRGGRWLRYMEILSSGFCLTIN